MRILEVSRHTKELHLKKKKKIIRFYPL